jgi:hypothetical protein
VPNNSIQYFLFNVTARYPGTYNITVNVTYVGGKTNATNLTVTVVDATNPVLFNDNNGPWNTTAVNGSTYNETSTISFGCNASDEGGIQNITLELRTLYLGGFLGEIFTNRTNMSGSRYNSTNLTYTVPRPDTYIWRCIAADNSSRVGYSANFSVTVNAFSISGWVKHANYTSNASGANVSIYEFIMSQQGPPTERIVKSTTAGAGGNFTLSDIPSNTSSQGFGGGGSQTIYKMTVLYTDPTTGLVTEVGPTLPPLPREALVWAMNGGTFYLQNATTIQLYAYNNDTISGAPATITNNLTKMQFGYMVMDQALGFPIASNMQTGVYTVNITVPSSRNYTVMFVRDPFSFGMQGDVCQGPGMMNATDCPSPPMSIGITTAMQNSTENNGTAQETSTLNYTGNLVTVNKSLAFAEYNLTGCLNVVGNTSDVNVLDITSKMIPWTGFMPPIQGEVSDFDAMDATDLQPGVLGCGLGRFNLTVMGSSAGIEWFIEAYAQNNTRGEYFAAFQNITITGQRSYNLTLVPLLGTLDNNSKLNVSKIQVNITDSNGTAPQDAHVEVFVNNTVFGGMHYIIETLTNGKFNMTFTNNTLSAEVRVFSNQNAPKEAKINLRTNRTDVILYGFRPQMMLDDGTFATDKMAGSKLTMRFMRYTSSCNVYTPEISCRIGNDNNGNFDPLQAMMAGKSNLWMRTTTNVTLYFINVDMLASGPPDAMMNENASRASASATGLEQVWKFGSVAPDIYDYVLIGIPYNASLNETMTNESSNWTYSINISLLYDNDNNVIWNVSTNTTAQLPSDYSDFNSVWFTSGTNCTTTATPGTQQCYINTTNDAATGHSGYMWLTIPHFSTTTNRVSGKTASLAAASTSSSSSSGGGGGSSTGTTYDGGALASPVTKELSAGDKITFTIDNRSHKLNLLGMTATTAVVQITAIKITLTKNFKVGESQLIDVNEDGKNDIEVTLKTVNLTTSKATFEVKSLAVAAPSEVTTPEENVTAPTQPTPTEEVPTTTIAEKEKPTWIKVVLILAILVVIVVVVVLIMKVAKK